MIDGWNSLLPVLDLVLDVFPSFLPSPLVFSGVWFFRLLPCRSGGVHVEMLQFYTYVLGSLCLN
jgi:hypothetical protein